MGVQFTDDCQVGFVLINNFGFFFLSSLSISDTLICAFIYTIYSFTLYYFVFIIPLMNYFVLQASYLLYLLNTSYTFQLFHFSSLAELNILQKYSKQTLHFSNIIVLNRGYV